MEKYFLYKGPKYKEAINSFNECLGKNSEVIELPCESYIREDGRKMYKLIEKAKSRGKKDALQALISSKKKADRKNHKRIQAEITDILKQMDSADVNEKKLLQDKIKELNKERRGFKYESSDSNLELKGDGIYVWGGLLWGTDKIYDYCVENNYNYYWIDNGYLIPEMLLTSVVRGKEGKKKTNRHKMGIYKIIKNGFHISKLIDRPDDRFNKFFNNELSIRNRNKRGSKDGYILVCPPSDDYQKVFGFTNWLENTINEIKKHTDRDIKIREKKIRKTIPLSSDLHRAYCTVAPASGVSIESILYGVPTFCSDFSPAAPVGNLDISKINNPWFPDKELIYKWLCHLCYCQFTLEEIQNGTALNILNNDI